jgi:transposase-like protein
MMQEAINQYPQYLKTLKQKLDGQAMSVLIGAGFSKNFNKDVFPNWWELIFDMVRDGLETEIADKYKQLYPKLRTKGKAYEQFLKNRVEKYIENVGPLEAVSEFIRRKGYREAVDVRIETKTPFIDIEDSTLFINYNVAGKAVRRPVLPGEMTIHQKLAALPWNNIYTTNYDNLLETSLDITVTAEFQRAIDDLSIEINHDQQERRQKEGELKKTNIEIEELQDRLNNAKSNLTGQPLDPGIGIDEKKLKELIPIKTTVERSIIYKTEEIDRKDERLAELKRNQSQVNSLVIYSSQLALKKNGNIIKLHGSVRANDTTEYGFDNDARMHYVISKEDFDNYPTKHEAFTQLMRISLLQESFCLLGFSGIDPNFLAWIGWVRDVIERRNADKTTRQEKIYLIDVGDKPADSERSQFHLNHRIAFIPLAHPDCRKFLEEQTGRNLSPTPNPRELVDLFLDYLSVGILPNKIIIAFEKFQQESYMQLWRKYAWRATPEGDIDNFFLFEKTSAYTSLRKYSRIPANTYNLHDRHDIISLLEQKLSVLKNDTESLSQLIFFSAQILEEQKLQLRNIFTRSAVFHDILKLAKKTNNEKYPFLLLVELRDAVWENNENRFKSATRLLSKYQIVEVQQELSYLKTLNAFFNFQFSQAEDLLANWNPQQHWAMKKAGLMFLLDPGKALSRLVSIRQDTVQETVYQLQLMAYINLALSKYSERTRLINQVEEITHEGLRDVNHNLDEILDKLNKNEQKIVPYGYDKFTTTRSMNFGGDNEWALAQMFFKLLAEFGFPLAVPHASFKTSDKTHAALFLAYFTIPYPVIFYLFQYTDEKIIIKIAQDYSTNIELDKDKLKIFENIKTLFFDEKSPSHFRINGLTFLSELINVIQPNEWEPFFYDVWAELQKTNSLFKERHFAKNHFIEKGLRLIQSPNIASKIINDSLMAIIRNEEGIDQATVVRFLYELNFNESLKIDRNAIDIAIDRAAIKTLTEAIHLDLEILFVLGNINFALDQEQRSAITERLRLLPAMDSTNERIWRIVLYFAAEDSTIIGKIKSAILNNKRLWDAGFTERGLSGTNNYISLYKLRSRDNILGINWTDTELKTLYNKLIETLTKIENWLRHHDGFTSFTAILEEMIWFLTFEKKRLSNFEDYKSAIARTNVLFIQEKGYERYIDGLVASDKEEYTTAQNELFYHLYNVYRCDDYDFEINTILNKILLQSEPGLAEALGAIVDWFSSFRSQENLKKYGDTLLQILKRYQKQLPKSIDILFLESKLIILAHTLKYWEMGDSAIDQQIALLKTSRFMEIRYNLAPILDKPI